MPRRSRQNRKSGNGIGTNTSSPDDYRSDESDDDMVERPHGTKIDDSLVPSSLKHEVDPTRHDSNGSSSSLDHPALDGTMPNVNNTKIEYGWEHGMTGNGNEAVASLAAATSLSDSPTAIVDTTNEAKAADAAGVVAVGEKPKWDMSGGAPMLSTPNCE